MSSKKQEFRGILMGKKHVSQSILVAYHSFIDYSIVLNLLDSYVLSHHYIGF